MKKLINYFRPVDIPTNTDTWLEFRGQRWEGWPATIIFIWLISPFIAILTTLVLLLIRLFYHG